MICEALRSRPKHMGTRLGTVGEIAYALSPKAVDRILHLAYRGSPSRPRSKGQQNLEERASFEQIAMATADQGSCTGRSTTSRPGGPPGPGRAAVGMIRFP